MCRVSLTGCPFCHEDKFFVDVGKHSGAAETTLYRSTSTMAENERRRATFLRLTDEYGPAMRRLAVAYARRDQVASEDLYQDVALAVWKAIPGYREESSERTWIYRIAHNVASTFRYRSARRAGRELAVDDRPEPTDRGDPESKAIERQRRERLYQALRELPTVDFQIASMHLDGLANEEIAAVAGLSKAAVATRLTRIRKRLAARLNDAEVRP